MARVQMSSPAGDVKQGSVRLRRGIAAVAAALGVTVLAAAPAGACGGLVGKNGTITLAKTTTLAAYHDGVERYVTSFEFTGEGEEVGSIIPLPDIPTDVTRGGDWTLQRLVREVAPKVERSETLDAAAPTAAGGAQVILQKEIDALDITILKGGGKEVGEWATKNGFLLTPDAPEVLEYYGDRSPVFMAAKFDATRAKELKQVSGQGTPIMLTIPTSEPWVPLRILGLGLPASQGVQADVFLLTDDEPKLLAGGSGLTINRSEAASKPLLGDLRSDKGMEWVPSSMWLSYLQVDAPAGDLHYDLAVSAHKDALPTIERAGITAPEARVIEAPSTWRRAWPVAVGLLTGLVAIATIVVLRRRSGPPAIPAAPLGGGPTTGSGPFTGGSVA